MSAHPGLVAILGSGETTQPIQRLYDSVMAQLESPINVGILETPAGFEPNSARVAARIATFLEEYLPHHRPRISLVPARRRGTAHSPDEPGVVDPLWQANFIIVGPGSPTYAARQLHDSLAWHIIQARHRLGAALVLASAGAIAAGKYVLPVYEIYKAGEDLHWRSGLNLLGPYGLDIVIVPHWNNADGGSELDTSRCYMGQARFQKLRDLLPADCPIVGIDEQTTLVLDFEGEVGRVYGPGLVTVARSAEEQRFPQGQVFPLGVLGRFRHAERQEGLPLHIWQQAVARHQEGQISQPDAAAWQLVEMRDEMRAQQDWVGADNLRRQLYDQGWQIEDSAEGPRLRRHMGGDDADQAS